eukprot:8655958-Karenia_brevis.AAC.1
MDCVLAILEDAQRLADHATDIEVDGPAEGQNDAWFPSLELRLRSVFSRLLSPDSCFYDSEACAAVRDLNMRQ